ncbi:hypothetical protein DF223_04860 [Mycetocola zhujimingii]|uniref:Uncharacterized protein n=2 Tax=Mycetocola zhujimingii TaxID=2079792 RepID=A0A2U1TFX8_9MICO|nr:hypothetical protein DF223_04860 [Mycetocola zhujimingii]
MAHQRLIIVHMTPTTPWRWQQQAAIHGCFALFLIGEVFALDAQLKQLSFGGPLTPRNIEGRDQMMWVAIAFIALAGIIGVVGKNLWIAGVLLIHSIAMLLRFNSGWGSTVAPTVLVCFTLWVVWTVRSIRSRRRYRSSGIQGDTSPAAASVRKMIG